MKTRTTKLHALLIPTLETLLPHARTYDEARARISLLAPYASAADLLPAIRSASPKTKAERNAVLLALVAENQRAPHPLWQSLLLAAFAPPIVRARKKLGPRRDEDADMQIVFAFLEALVAVRANEHALTAIHWAVRDVVTERHRRARLAPPLVTFKDEMCVANPFGADAETRAMAREALEHIEKRGHAEIVPVLVATEAGDETLADYVARVFPGASAVEQARQRDRLGRERERVVQAVRARLRASTRAA